MLRDSPGWTTSPFPTTSAPLAHQTGEHAHQLDDGKASRPNFTFPSLPVRHSESWSPDGRRREHSRPDNLTFSSPTLGDAYPPNTASIVLLSGVGESLPARPYRFHPTVGETYPLDSVSIGLP